MTSTPAEKTRAWPALSQHLLQSAAHERIGITLAPHSLAAQLSDVPGIVNAAVSAEKMNLWQDVSGAVAFDDVAQARAAAVAEAVERYVAAMSPLALRPRSQLAHGEYIDESALALFSSAQLQQPQFPWPVTQSADDFFVGMHRLSDNQVVWVPQELVGLGVRQGASRWPSTSSGLAAHRDAAAGPWLAVLRAAQEVLERDALAVTWLNGLGGREIDIPKRLLDTVATMGAQVHAFDLTQSWNPHPVVAIAGRLDAQGLARHAFGIACRSNYDDAIDKAWLEWAQSLRYAEFIRQNRAGSIPERAADLRRFDEHAAFYTVHPQHWDDVPLLRYRQKAARSDKGHSSASLDVAGELEVMWRALQTAGIELLYRELTTADAACAGLRVVRVTAPALSPLHADERAPFLGGRCADIEWRYPGAQTHTPLPNPWPHPLG